MKKEAIKVGLCAAAASCALVLTAPAVCNIAGMQTQTDAYAATCKLSKKSVSIESGASQSISLKGITAKQSKSVKWSSTDAKVAKVKKTKKNGVYICNITGVSAGSCNVKAVYKKKTYKCKVTVKKPVVTVKTVMEGIANSKSSFVNKNGNRAVKWDNGNGSQFVVVSDTKNNCIDFISIMTYGTASTGVELQCKDSANVSVELTYFDTANILSCYTTTTTLSKTGAMSSSSWNWQNVTGIKAELADAALKLSLAGWDVALITTTNHRMADLGFTK